MNTIRILTKSYKPKEFKRGYLRVNGKFADQSHHTKNHRFFTAELKNGDVADARGSAFDGGNGLSRWDAPKPQWVRIKMNDGKLVFENYDGDTVTKPDWIQGGDNASE